MDDHAVRRTERRGRLEDRVVLVTGAAQGIGRAVVDRSLAEGARVALLDIDGPGVERAAQEAAGASGPDGAEERAPRCVGVRADVGREDEVRSAVGHVVRRLGPVDVLVNNAGINAYDDPSTMTEQAWDAVFAVDLKGAWLCAKHVLPSMRQRRYGSVVNIASIHARLTTAGMFPYAAAKAGLVGMTRSLALEVARDGIRVNAVCPGWTATRLVEESFTRQPDPEGARRAILDAHPLGRIATPDEIANVVVFVASDEASFMTGSEVYVDGGLGARFAG